ncbi:MAG: ABC transporter ATP-binding protein [Clostridia bacterium]|nr:ABC transporter ATP-binding protein [Clostridia bacterium]
MKQKKQNEISVLLGYAGKYKALTFLGMFLSAVAMIMGMMPYVCIWLAARDLIKAAPNWTGATEIAKYGWWAFGFAFGGIIVYFAALMCTHLAAFRTAANIRKQGVAHMMKAPLGFFDNNASGLLRNRLDGGAAETETLLAHNLADIVGTAAMPCRTHGYSSDLSPRSSFCRLLHIYTEEKKDGTDKTFADRIEDFIGSEFAELTDIDDEPNILKKNAHRAAGKER